MSDNFNLAKFLRNNPLLNEGIGGYVDLMPLREEESDMVTIQLDMAWDSSNPEEDAAAKAAFDQYGIEVSDETGRPGTYEVTGRKEDILAYLKSEFYGMDDESIQQYYPELLNGEMSEGEPDGEQYDGKYDAKSGPAITNELEKPENVYADDSFAQAQRDAASPVDSGDFDRMFDLGGDQIEKGIMFLLDDGFEPEDVLEMCKMFIDAHSEAAAKGKNFESQINEYESSYQLINGKCYRVDDEGNRTAASMSKCR